MTAPQVRPLDSPATAGPPSSQVGDGLDGVMPLVAAGDERAFGLLYDAMAGPVLGLVRRVLRDAAQSEEVTQEVLLEVWRTAARYRPERGGVAAWVLTIAHSRAVDRVRSVRASADRDRRVTAASHLPPSDEVVEAVERRLDGDRVRECLGELSEVQRQCLTLAYYGGLTQTQIADAVGAPLGTVKTRMRDGLIRMRRLLAAEQ
ncbi:sigma-70 family RNA polymerase sigma factor [Kitasatospora paranensis]